MEQKKFKNKLDINLDMAQLSMTNKEQDVLTIYYSQDDKDWVIYDKEPTDNADIKNIRTLTYNVWFQNHHFQERVEELKKIMIEQNPDIICLQEVTEKFQTFLSKDKFFYENYQISGNKIDNHGCLILSKFSIRFRLVELDSNMQRALLVGQMKINGQNISVATCHLESMKENAEIRGKQLKKIFDILKEDENSILMGDFNIEDGSSEESNFDNSFVDQWKLLNKDGQDGNTMFVCKDGVKAWRPDRVFLKSGAWKSESSQIVGKNQIPYYNENKPTVENEITTPSDHYGIVVNFVPSQ